MIYILYIPLCVHKSTSGDYIECICLNVTQKRGVIRDTVKTNSCKLTPKEVAAGLPPLLGVNYNCNTYFLTKTI